MFVCVCVCLSRPLTERITIGLINSHIAERQNTIAINSTYTQFTQQRTHMRPYVWCVSLINVAPIHAFLLVFPTKPFECRTHIITTKKSSTEEQLEKQMRRMRRCREHNNTIHNIPCHSSSFSMKSMPCNVLHNIHTHTVSQSAKPKAMCSTMERHAMQRARNRQWIVE